MLGQKTVDQRGRNLRDLRISLTDRCNMRCTYCMPKEIFGPDFPYLPREEILSFEEIVSVVRCFVSVGVRKIRLTGGEPLLRRNLPFLVEQISEVEGVEDLALTTNGVLLPKFADALRAAGLSRVTVSLDSLDNAVFAKINDRGYRVEQVLAGIEAAQDAGLSVKVNAVIERGVNDDQVVSLARFFKEKNIILRFIEFMDVGNHNGWNLDKVVPSTEIIEKLDREIGVLPMKENYRGEVATRYAYRDGAGEFGVISSISQPFCGDCNRARLSAKGELYTCLFAKNGFSLRDALRSGKSEDEMISLLNKLWSQRDDRYSEERAGRTQAEDKVEMSYIGG